MADTLPFRLEFSDYVLVEWIGEPTLDNTRLAQRYVLAHPQFRVGMPVIIVDIHSAYNPTEAEIKQQAFETAQHRNLFGPIALVFRSKLHFGIGNMLKTYSEMQGLRVGVFGRVEDAVSWVREESSNPPPQQMQSGA